MSSPATAATRAGSECRSPGRGSQPLDYVAWLNLQADNLNRDDPITADLSQITIATAGILEADRRRQDQVRAADHDLAGLEKDPGREGARACPMSAGCSREFKPDDKRYTLAAHVTGAPRQRLPRRPAASAEPKPGEAAGPEAARTPSR